MIEIIDPCYFRKMQEHCSATVINIEEANVLITPEQSHSIFSTSLSSPIKEKNPLLRGEKHALVITVLQVVSAEQHLTNFHLMVRVGTHYYKGEVFQLGAKKKKPQNIVLASSTISSPISRNGDMVLVSNEESERPMQSNANIELCQRFIFWISLHAELFDYVHVSMLPL